MVWYGMVWYEMVWYDGVRYDTMGYGMIRYGVVWYSMEWYSMVWLTFDSVFLQTTPAKFELLKKWMKSTLELIEELKTKKKFYPKVDI